MWIHQIETLGEEHFAALKVLVATVVANPLVATATSAAE
jgi:hypothetical protein